jgi:hypothetical protein
MEPGEHSNLPPDRLCQPATAKSLAVLSAMAPLVVKRRRVREKRGSSLSL